MYNVHVKCTVYTRTHTRAEMQRVWREEERLRASPLMQSPAVLDLTRRLQPQLLQLVISQRCNFLRAGTLFLRVPMTPGSSNAPPRAYCSRTRTYCSHM